MTSNDIRWQQRFDNFKNALKQLSFAVEESQKRELNDLEKQGLIQAFEFTHELSWNLLKDYIENKGATDLIGSKDTTRQAFKVGLIIDGESWMSMIKSRNLSSHTYNQEIAIRVINDIIHKYFLCFKDLEKKMSSYLK